MQSKKFLNIINKIKSLKIEAVIVSLISAYCISASVLLLVNKILAGVNFTGIEFVENSNLIVHCLLIAVIFITLFAVSCSKKNPRTDKAVLFVSTIVYFSLLCLFGFNEWFFMFLCIFAGVCCYYCFGKPESAIRIKKRLPLGAVFAVSVILAAFCAVEAVFRYKGLNALTFDAGLYSQMFENMMSSGFPFTTLAGMGEQSRFLTDPSPILYVLLPLFMLFDSLTPYLILQCAAVLSGIIPLYLICKSREYSNGVIAFIALIYSLYAGLWAGTFYDFHEQSLFVPLLLWLMYFAEKNNSLAAVIFAILTLLTGKEGIIYVFAAGVYIFFGMKKRVTGALCAALALAAFIAAKVFMPDYALFGGNVFTDRELLQAASSAPGYLLKNLLVENKIKFIAVMIFPLAGIPFITKKISSYLLFLPIVFISLFSFNSYDSSVYYQHAFGSAALLIYMFAINFPEIKTEKRRFFASLCLFASVISFCGCVLSRCRYIENYSENKEIVSEAEKLPSVIPEDASVAVSDNLTVLFADRRFLFSYSPEFDENGVMIDYFPYANCDYAVFSLFGDYAEANMATANLLLAEGYTAVQTIENTAIILKAP